jgi:ABC-type polysaccharide/polyol phosphate transport system ATPase subunit
LRTIAGVYKPDEGLRIARGRVAPLLSFDGDLKPGLSGWENIALSGVLLGLTRRQTRGVAGRIAEFSGLGEFLHSEVRVYSTGMKARLGFAVAALVDPEVLVLDEAMTAGDYDFQDRSQALIRGFLARGRTVIIASHEIESLARQCDRLVHLKGGLIVEEGAPDGVAARYLDHADRELSP